jgi:two-component system sensor histidine kinase TctE
MAYIEAGNVVDLASDRLIASSARAIAETISVTEDNDIYVEIPYSALEALSSPAQDKVYYRVTGPDGETLTGYDDLPVATAMDTSISFLSTRYRGSPVRVATLGHYASSGRTFIPFSVTVAETTQARSEMRWSMVVSSVVRQSIIGLIGMLFVVVGINSIFSPILELTQHIGRRTAGDLRPISKAVPRELEPLVASLNSFMLRLDQLVQRMRDFSASVSHQLRNPLSELRTNIAIAKSSNDMSRVRKLLDHSDEAIVGLDQLIDSFLRLARFEFLARPELRGNVDVNKVLADVVSAYYPSARRAKQDMFFEGDEDAVIDANAELISEAVVNIIENAIKYSGSGSTISAVIDAKSDNVLVRISDTGVGVPDETLASLGGKFFRGSEDQRGMGIGLSISREIVELFGGTLEISKNIPLGLCVTISFLRMEPVRERVR